MLYSSTTSGKKLCRTFTLWKRSKDLGGGPRPPPWTGGNGGSSLSMLRQCPSKPSREHGFLSPSCGDEASLPLPSTPLFSGGHWRRLDFHCYLVVMRISLPPSMVVPEEPEWGSLNFHVVSGVKRKRVCFFYHWPNFSIGQLNQNK